MQWTIRQFPAASDDVNLLPTKQQMKLLRIAIVIAQSHQPDCTPVRSVLLAGHADFALEREKREPGFLAKISRARALAVQKELIRLIGARPASRIRWTHQGDGDRSLVVPHPRTEVERALNRRVVVTLNPGSPAVAPPPAPVPQRQPAPRPQPQPQPATGRFPRDVIDAAVASHRKWGVPTSVILAQWVLESGFGSKTPPGSNNPLGIKATGSQPFVEGATQEIVRAKRSRSK